jgi:phosphoribosylamine--glycine ligase
LVAGIVDRFEAAGLRCFGPRQAAAQLEGSKAFSKDFMARHGIPTASYAAFSELEPALDYVRKQGAPIVIKADGLAAGKGVIVAQTVAEAEDAVRGMLTEGDFGEAGQRVVIEECLIGEEASFIAMVDGNVILPLATSQDHKARDNGDEGPNTGGMGAYSPAPAVTPEISRRIMTEVMQPAVEGMKKDNCPYVGFLYAGIMIAADGSPKVLEFNCRLGDPETQPILMRLRSDLAELIEAALEQKLGNRETEWDARIALGVVMAAGGYPASYRKGDRIDGLPTTEDENLKVFHAGTTQKNRDVVTNGGRVLCAVALGDTTAEAQTEAYELVSRITWTDVYYRTDIGYRAVARERENP